MPLALFHHEREDGGTGEEGAGDKTNKGRVNAQVLIWCVIPGCSRHGFLRNTSSDARQNVSRVFLRVIMPDTWWQAWKGL